MKTVDYLELEQVKGGVSGWTMVGISALLSFSWQECLKASLVLIPCQ